MIIHALSELTRADLPVVGGKGANLGELTRLGLAVPPGFVVGVDAYVEQARAWGLAERLAPHLAAGDWEAAAAAASELCLHGDLLEAVAAPIREAYRKLGAPVVAVRSSATAEDLADASFAGQHETFLDVSGEAALLLSIRGCWASLWSPPALGYRAARGIEHLGVAMAVVVQRMVHPDFAGVLFTVDPVAGRADRMLLEVAPGLGEAVVSGQTTGDVYRLTRAADGDTIVIAERDRRDPGRPAPGDALVLAVARLGLRLEAHFGSPQDVEFALAGGAVHVLQSRPITTLAAADLEPIPPLPELTWIQRKMAAGNSNDRFPVAPRPLDQWGLRMVFPALVRTVRYAGFAVRDADEQAFMAPMWREIFLPPPMRPTLRLLGLPAKVAASLREDWMGWWEGEAFVRIQQICAPTDLTALTDAALLERADRITTATTEIMSKRFRGVLGQAAVPVLRLPVTLALGRERAAVLMPDLVSGLRTRTSEVNDALHELAREAVRAGPDVTAPIRAGTPAALQDTPAGRDFLARVDAFLAEHGYRETTGLYLSVPMWRRDPRPMWGLLRGMLDVETPAAETAGARRYAAALAEVTHALRFVPGLPAAFTRVLERVRAAVVYRERSHFDLGRLFAALQDIALELGQRLHARGHLPRADDVFYLTEAEVRAWLSGQVPAPAEIEPLVRRRRATYDVVNGRWQQWAFPASKAAAGDVLRGNPASSGVVRGPARVILEERDFGRLQPGEILVCRFTNPAWTPLFTIAVGVVTDTGGAASHAAIVAREYGIPAVLGAAGATGRITDGQQIVVDGTNGVVTLVPAEDPHA